MARKRVRAARKTSTPAPPDDIASAEEAAPASEGAAPASEGAAPASEGAVMPLMEHLKELRKRLIRASIALLITTAVSFFFTRQVLVFLIAPMGDTLPQALKPTESLGNYMKVALLCGVILAMPVIAYQVGRFIMPGLTKSEKRYLWLLVPGATICFVTGVAFAYFIMMPAAIPFLQGFLADIIEQQWAIGEYLSFVTSLLFWLGLSFELPLFVFFLAKLGVVNAQMLSKYRKYAILIIAVLAAVITPTVDPLNMTLVMGPLIVLYELGVILARIA
jgi:sec-independent protein translocase protein TatC